MEPTAERVADDPTLAVAIVSYGLANVAAVAGGAWFKTPKLKAPLPAVQPL